LILSADPGVTGALCCFDEVARRVVSIDDMPAEKNKRGKLVIDEERVVDWFRGYEMLGVKKFVCEKVGGLPRQSAPAAFVFGHGYGSVLMAARMCNFEVHLVRPQEWKSRLGVSRYDAAKLSSLKHAATLLSDDVHWWPRYKDHGRCEAALIALYGARFIWGDEK
jgi:hypothetical protein